jgi:ribonuclease HI
MIRVNCDGSIAGGNPGGVGYTGFVVKDGDGAVIHRHSDYLGAHKYMTNNVAEYGAVLSALLWLKKQALVSQDVEIRTDSQLVVRQLEGRWQCVHPVLLHLKESIEKVACAFSQVTYIWVPREQNQDADDMSKSLQR